jgi:integrase
MAFSDFWLGYFDPEVISKRKISTQQMYRYLGQKHLLPFFGQRRLCDLERAEVQDFINLKQREDYSPKTLRHLRNLLGKAFGVAISRDWMAHNPARNLELPRMERRRQARVLTLKEIADLLKAFDEQLRAVFLLGLLPGLRIGEILGLQVQDLDLEGQFFHVRRNVYRGHVQSTPKTAAGERWVPLASPVLEALKAWLAVRPLDSEWLFPNEAGKPYYERNLLRRKLWPVCNRVGIARFGWHSLRHTFSTYGGNNGVPLPVLQYLLGHASVETTMIYTHPLGEAQREAVERMASILLPNAPKTTNTRKKVEVTIQ